MSVELDEVGNVDNIRIYGGLEDGVYVAPLGTAIVESLADLGIDYKGLGLLSEDGLEEDIESELVEVVVHQGFRVARSKVTGLKHTFKVIAAEENDVVYSLRFPAAVKTTDANGVTVIRDVEKTKRDERVVVVDTFDGDIHKRRIYTRAEATEKATLSRKGNEGTAHEFTFTSYGRIIDITNDPALAEGAAPTEPTPTS